MLSWRKLSKIHRNGELFLQLSASLKKIISEWKNIRDQIYPPTSNNQKPKKTWNYSFQDTVYQAMRNNETTEKENKRHNITNLTIWEEFLGHCAQDVEPLWRLLGWAEKTRVGNAGRLRQNLKDRTAYQRELQRITKEISQACSCSAQVYDRTT